MRRFGIVAAVALGLAGVACLVAIPLVIPAEESEDPLALAFGAGLLWIAALAVYLAVRERPWLAGAVASIVIAILTAIAIAATGFTTMRGVVFVIASAMAVLSFHRTLARRRESDAGPAAEAVL